MNLRWSIAFLIIAFAFIGISVEQPVAHNQEIVVQFNTGVNSSQEAQKAIKTVKKNLQRIGVHDLQVSATLEGTLKITYYSDAEVSVVKELFANETALDFGAADFSTKKPSENKPAPTDYGYELNVSEIPTHSDNGLGLNGTLIELKSVNDRYVPPVVYFRTIESSFETNKIIEAKTVACYTDTALLTDIATYKIPEVRAGPFA